MRSLNLLLLFTAFLVLVAGPPFPQTASPLPERWSIPTATPSNT